MRTKRRVFTDAARFQQLSRLLLDNGGSFPDFERIETLVSNDAGLRAWVRDYPKPSQFMSDAKFFFYREKNKRNKQEPRIAEHT